jgi:hypothetical protein
MLQLKSSMWCFSIALREQGNVYSAILRLVFQSSKQQAHTNNSMWCLSIHTVLFNTKRIRSGPVLLKVRAPCKMDLTLSCAVHKTDVRISAIALKFPRLKCNSFLSIVVVRFVVVRTQRESTQVTENVKVKENVRNFRK